MRTRSGSFRLHEEIFDEDAISPLPEAPIVIQPFLKDDVLSEVINVSPLEFFVKFDDFSLSLGDTHVIVSYCLSSLEKQLT